MNLKSGNKLHDRAACSSPALRPIPHLSDTNFFLSFSSLPLPSPSAKDFNLCSPESVIAAVLLHGVVVEVRGIDEIECGDIRMPRFVIVRCSRVLRGVLTLTGGRVYWRVPFEEKIVSLYGTRFYDASTIIPRVSSWLPSPFIPFRESLNRYRDNFSSTFFYNFMIN